MPLSWTEEQLKEAVANSKGISEVVSKLYTGFAGSHFPTVWKHIRRLGLVTSHLNGRTGNRVQKEIFGKGRRVGSGILRKAFLKVSEYRCECGNGGEWMGKKLTLQLDHKDGDNANNLKENLRWLCPNCHSQTPTYAKIKSKPITTERPKPRPKPRPKTKVDCSGCGKGFEIDKTRLESKRKKGQTNFYCKSSCSWKSADRDSILRTYEETKSYLETGRRLGLSNVAVRKFVIRESSKGRNEVSDTSNVGSNPASRTSQSSPLDPLIDNLTGPEVRTGRRESAGGARPRTTRDGAGNGRVRARRHLSPAKAEAG